MKRIAIGEFEDKYIAEVSNGRYAVYFKETGNRVVKGVDLPYDSIYAHLGGHVNPCNIEFKSDDE